jgi:quercetin dioxygenase-like cupin family protein
MTKERITVLENCLAKAQDLNALIDYAPDAVVSKTILDKNVGTITLFAFDKGQRLSEHTAPYHATVQVIDGKGVFTIDGKDIQAAAGQILIMPANIPHAVYASEKFKMLLIMIRQ